MAFHVLRKFRDSVPLMFMYECIYSFFISVMETAVIHRNEKDGDW